MARRYDKLTCWECDAELEGQGSGTPEAGQDVGSPMKKMRMGSGVAHTRDAGN